MDPVHIIKYLNLRYRSFWRDERGLKREHFSLLLRPHVPRLSDSQYTRLTSHKEECTSSIAEALARPDVLKKIESALGLPHLFSCKSESEIDSLIAGIFPALRIDTDENNAVTGLLIPDVSKDERIPLSSREERLAKHLAGLITQGKANVLCWSDPPPVGAAFLTYTIAGISLSLHGFTSNFLIQPFPSASKDYLSRNGSDNRTPNFDQALIAVARKLGLPGRPTAAALLDALTATRSILFILNADCLASSGRNAISDTEALIREARKRPAPQQGGPVSIVLIGRPPSQTTTRGMVMHGDVRTDLAFGSKLNERNEFFATQWQRFCALRGRVGFPVIGHSRLKRAKQYYTAEAGDLVWPSNLRVLAFFAANDDTLSYFDPTAGWDRLAGKRLEELPIDIRLHLSEVVLQARAIPGEAERDPALRVARWCSTAVYWLTEGAAEDLGRLSPRTNQNTFRSAIDSLDRLVDIVERVGYGSPVYKMDMALRSVIQQRWALTDPFNRAEAHYQVARRLYRWQDNKDLLYAEFPIEPHWGRSRMHILSECLRHLVRTCDQVSGRISSPYPPEFSEEFPDPPTKEQRGCDPGQIINFCFAQIFWKELNGNGHSGAVHNRKLALRHGAYHLTAELLELMSKDGELGEPHPSLNPSYIKKYLREVGYALLDLGELQRARRTFERLLIHVENNIAEPWELVQVQLDLTIVLCAMSKLDEARRNLTQARSRAPLLAGPDANAKARKADKTIEVRLDAREADLLYREGKLEGALEACERIERKYPSSITRDVAHIYIATLGALGGEERLQRAMAVCLRNLFDNSSRGLHHETLGFRIALGHTFRKQGQYLAAEVTLDQVYKDVLQFGCSERTYLAFLLEAGRTVLIQKRPARAYAAYLRPCLELASARGHIRIARTARDYALQCLAALLEKQCSDSPLDTSALLEQLEGRGEFLGQTPSTLLDPQYSFEIAAIDRWASRLSARDGLEAELQTLR